MVRNQTSCTFHVSVRHLTAEVWVIYQARHVQFVVGDRFPSITSVFQSQCHSTNASYALYQYVTLTRTNGRSVGTFQKTMPFRISWGTGQKPTFSFIRPSKVGKEFHRHTTLLHTGCRPVSSGTLCFNVPLDGSSMQR